MKKLTKEEKEQVKNIIREIANDETITDGQKILIEKLDKIGLTMQNKYVAKIIFLEIEEIKKEEKKE